MYVELNNGILASLHVGVVGVVVFWWVWKAQLHVLRINHERCNEAFDKLHDR